VTWLLQYIWYNYKDIKASFNNEGPAMKPAKKLSNNLREQTDKLLQLYTAELGTLIDDHGLSRTAFSVFKPNNRFIGLDTSEIHFVFSFNNAVPGMAMVHHSDLREFGDVSTEQIVQVCQHNLGYREYVHFSLPANILSLSEDEIRKELQKTARDNLQRELDDIVRRAQALYVPTDLIEKYLAECTEDEFIENILLPLLRQLGFERVRATGHEERILEYGRDIQGLKLRLSTGHYLYFAGQVKRGSIHATTRNDQNVSTILTQLRMIYDSDSFDYDINKHMKVDHALLISSGKINRQGRNLLEKALEDENRRILVLDGQDIIELCLKHGLPDEIQKKIQKRYSSG
jgi:hypothetical protein